MLVSPSICDVCQKLVLAGKGKVDGKYLYHKDCYEYVAGWNAHAQLVGAEGACVAGALERAYARAWLAWLTRPLSCYWIAPLLAASGLWTASAQATPAA